MLVFSGEDPILYKSSQSGPFLISTTGPHDRPYLLLFSFSVSDVSFLEYSEGVS